MIPLKEAIQIHALLIQKIGGTIGIRDREAPQLVLNSPDQMISGQELYPTAEEKAATILESIISNHPFLAGNKRLGYVLMRITLLVSRLDTAATHKELYNFIINVAMGKLNIGKIITWIVTIHPNLRRFPV